MATLGISEIIRRGLDHRIVSLKGARSAMTRPSRGWLRAVRDAIGLSQATMGKKLHIKRQSYAQSEAAEERGAISLTSLQRAAEAMDCELVYFIVPREGVASTYTELAQIHDPGFKHLRAVEHSMALEGQGITDYQKTKLAWRYASSADLGLLAEWNHQLIRDEGHRNPMTVEQLAGRMAEWLRGEYQAVIFSDGKPVAYALFKKEERLIYLRQLFVHRDRRRCGIGREAFRILRQQIWLGDVRLTVDVLCRNPGAIAFWRSVGYQDYSLTLEIMPD